MHASTWIRGWISIISYSVATGLSLAIVAELGILITKSHPHVMSLNDFVGKRYGPAVQHFVVLIEMVNMVAVLLAEYTAVSILLFFLSFS